jgi:hypothetical protein
MGISELGPWGVFAVFAGLIFAVGGVSAFALGISFNYLVALLHRRPIRQVTLIEKIVGISPERHFTWIGTCLVAGGTAMGILSSFGLRRKITRLWFWQLGSAPSGQECSCPFGCLFELHTEAGNKEVGKDLFGPDDSGDSGIIGIGRVKLL